MWSLSSSDNRNTDSGPPLATPRLRKWNDATRHSLDLGSDSHYDQLQSIRNVLSSKSRNDFPEVPDGSSTWTATFDRLSKKITAQKHELWDCQSKLRIEAEKNRDLAKIIQAERKQHREVESVLLSKIEYLESEISHLRRHEASKTNPVLDGHYSHQQPSQTYPAQTPLQQQSSQSQQPYQSQPQQPSQLQAQSVQPQPIKEMNHVDQRSSSSASNGSQNEYIVSEMLKKIEALTLENQKLKEATSNHESTDPIPNFQNSTDTKERVDKSSSNTLLADNERILASNRELQEEMKLQRAELSKQIAHYENMRTHFEHLLLQRSDKDDLVDLLLHQLKPSKRRVHTPTLQKADHNSTKLASPISPESPFYKQHSNSNGDATFGNQYSTEASTTSEEALKPDTTPGNSSAPSTVNDISTVASSTSTPSSIKQRHYSSKDSNVERLDRLYHKLRHGKLSQDDIARYENIYSNSLRSFSERPQLHTESRQLLHELQAKVGGVGHHAKMLKMVENDSLPLIN